MLYRKDSFIKTFFTKKQAISITSRLSRQKIFVHNGKSIIFVKITKGLVGSKLGALSLRKKLGKSISKCEKGKKKRNQINKHPRWFIKLYQF